MSSIVDLTLVELIDKIKKKEVSSKETTNAYIERCKKSKKLNSFITEDFDHALKKSLHFHKMRLRYHLYSYQKLLKER